MCQVPLSRGDEGVCDGEVRGFAQRVLEVRFLGFSDCFYFKWLCLYVTHPLPLSRGEIKKLLYYFVKNYFILGIYPN